VIKAHGAGPLAPSIFDGKPALQGVRALALRHADTELLSGGADGKVIIWDITTGTIARQLRTIEARARACPRPRPSAASDALSHPRRPRRRSPSLNAQTSHAPEPLRKPHLSLCLPAHDDRS